jgi:hypothetical protein
VDFSLRTPEGLSKLRPIETNRSVTDEFLDMVEEITQEQGIQENPEKLLNWTSGEYFPSENRC